MVYDKLSWCGTRERSSDGVYCGNSRRCEAHDTCNFTSQARRFFQLSELRRRVLSTREGEPTSHDDDLMGDIDPEEAHQKIIALIEEIKQQVAPPRCGKAMLLPDAKEVQEMGVKQRFVVADVEEGCRGLSYRGAADLVFQELSRALPSYSVVPVFVSTRHLKVSGSDIASRQHAVPSADDILDVAKAANQGNLRHRGTISVESLAMSWWHSGKKAQLRYLRPTDPLITASAESYGVAFKKALSGFVFRGDPVFDESPRPVVVAAVYIGNRDEELKHPRQTVVTDSSKMSVVQKLLERSIPSEEWRLFWGTLLKEFEVLETHLAREVKRTTVKGIVVTTHSNSLPEISLPMTPFWRDSAAVIYIRISRSIYGHHQFVYPDKEILSRIVRALVKHGRSEGGQFASVSSEVTSDSWASVFKKKKGTLDVVVKTVRRQLKKHIDVEGFGRFASKMPHVAAEVHSVLVNDIVPQVKNFPFRHLIVSICHKGKTC